MSSRNRAKRWFLVSVAAIAVGFGAFRYLSRHEGANGNAPTSSLGPPLVLTPAQRAEVMQSGGTEQAASRPSIETIPIPKTWNDFTNKIGFDLTPDARAIETGETLAATHCVGCHDLPNPSILPKASWLDLGAQKHDIMVYLGQISSENVASTCYPRVSLAFPPHSEKGHSLSRREIAAIFAYYYSAAPDEALPQEEKPAASSSAAPFTVKAAKRFMPPYPSYLGVAVDRGRIVAASVQTRLDVFGPDTRLTHQVPLPGVPAGVVKGPGGWYVTIVGSSLIDRSLVDGKIIRLPENAFEAPGKVSQETIAEGLRRPRLTRFADVDGDGATDMLVGETGGREGALSVRRNLGNGNFDEPQVIFEGAGTEWVTPFDANADGRADILSLVGLAKQEGYLFLNQAGGKFSRETIVSQFAGFGYRHAEPVDLDGDGRPEFVTTNGNRMNLLSFPKKNFHGIRVLAADSGGDYRERYFYPMHGAGGTIARDFDGDGDQDLIAIAFSPDFTAQPLESIVYLENRGDFRFMPHRIPQAENGRWSYMAIGELDGDGREELVLVAAYPRPQDSRTKGVFGEGERNGLLVLGTKVPAHDGL